jgi:hypothetical protein
LTRGIDKMYMIRERKNGEAGRVEFICNGGHRLVVKTRLQVQYTENQGMGTVTWFELDKGVLCFRTMTAALSSKNLKYVLAIYRRELDRIQRGEDVVSWTVPVADFYDAGHIHPAIKRSTYQEVSPILYESNMLGEKCKEIIDNDLDCNEFVWLLGNRCVQKFVGIIKGNDTMTRPFDNISESLLKFIEPVLGNSSIPSWLRFDRMETREWFLAGFIDACDIHDSELPSKVCLCISSFSEQSVLNLHSLIRSLGIPCEIACCVEPTNIWKVCIPASCPELQSILSKCRNPHCRAIYNPPGALERKSIPLFFDVLELPGLSEYFGFSIEGPDHLFLLSNATVVHNCDSYGNNGAFIQFSKNDMNIKQFVNVDHPFVLPNFENVFQWSLPFVAEKTAEIFNELLMTKMNEEPLPDKNDLRSITTKIKALGRLAQMYQTLSQEKESFLLLKGLASNCNQQLPTNLLVQGRKGIMMAIDSFQKAKALDDDRRPGSEGGNSPKITRSTLDEPKSTGSFILQRRESPTIKVFEALLKENSSGSFKGSSTNAILKSKLENISSGK